MSSGADGNELRVTFELLDGSIGIIAPTPSLAKQTAALSPAYATLDSDRAVREEYALKQLDEDWVVETLDTDAGSFADLADAMEGLEQLIANRLLAMSANLPHLHASGAVLGGAAVLALGESGAGKTSLALELNLQGHPVLGDDVLLIAEGGELIPFKRHFSVHQPRLALHKVPANPMLDWMGNQEEAWFDPSTAGGWSEPTHAGVVARVRYTPGASTAVKEMSRPETLTLLLASLLPTGLNARSSFDSVFRVAEAVVGVEIVFSDTAEAAEALLGYLG